MEISLNAQVECIDGVCGHSIYVLINPVVEQITHMVVKAKASPHAEYIVPLALISESIVGTIRLHCTQAEFYMLEPFIQTGYIQERVPEYVGNVENGMGSNFYYPYVTPEMTIYQTVENQQIPAGEMAVRRGTRVEATDGFVGNVDEFVVNPENGKITHLVMREGHAWEQKDVLIPLSAMGEPHADTLHLKLDKHQIENLPTFPVHRLWE
jgi:hypothetical protein